MLNGKWCRASRAVLGWGQDELATRARVAKGTIVAFEREARLPHDRTIVDIQRSIEEAGIKFEFSDGKVVGMYLSGTEVIA